MHTFLVSFASDLVSQANYSLTISNPSLTAPVNTPATFNGTLTASACYTSAVNLSCGSDHPPTCTPPLPGTVTPTPGGTPFTVTVGSNVNQTYNFNIAGVGKDTMQLQRQQPVTFISGSGGPPPPFSFTVPAPPVQSAPAGQTATFTLVVTPVGGPFPSDVTLKLLDPSDCPPLSTLCALGPTPPSKGSSTPIQATFTITTTAPVIAGVRPARAFRPPIYALWLSLPGLMVAFAGLRQQRRRRKRFVIFLLLTLIVPGLWLEIACSGGLQGNGTGGNGQAGTTPGTYTMMVSATVSGLPPVNVPVTLTVN
jgi:hypothetical protein